MAENVNKLGFLQITDKLIRVRDKLNSEKVQLWNPPYYIPGVGSSDSDLQALAQRYSGSLGMAPDCCLCALVELQSAALENLESKTAFQELGTASFKVKVPNGHIRVSAKLDDRGEVLIQKVADKLNLPTNKLRLIGKGRLINGDEPLIAQGISNNQKLLVIVLEGDVREQREEESVFQRLKAARDDVKLLMEQGNKYMAMEDQHGNAIHLPPDEQKSLMLALAIHEKGKSAMRRGCINEALYLFLEADNEFSQCRSALLSTVDNYALLYLDIVWCYLKLRSVDHLQDADRRLREAEEQLNKSYGPSLSRVEQIKGTSVNERALLARLHLMQGIVAYHQNKRDEARSKFNDLQMELQALKVDEDSLTSLVEMGLTDNEARIALREALGNTSDAVTRIYRKREMRDSARKTAKKERKVAQQNKREWVNPKTLIKLTEMGYEIEAARVALRVTNNDIDKALSLLADIPALLAEYPPDDSTDGNNLDQERKLMDKILNLNINPELAAKVFKAIQNLTKEQMTSFFEQAHAYEGERQDVIAVLLESLNEKSMAGPSASSSASSSQAKDESKLIEVANRLLEEKSAYERFSEDISVEEEDHLDFSLVDEERLLLEYISVLGM